MDKLLETYILPKLNYEEIKKKKKPVGCESAPKTSQQRNTLSQMVSLVNSAKYLKNELQYFSNASRKLKRRNTPTLILQDLRYPGTKVS